MTTLEMTTSHGSRAVQDGTETRAVSPIRVALVADDEVTTRGLASMLREHPGQFEPVTIASRTSAPIDIALYDPAVGSASRADRLDKLLSDPDVRKVAIFTSASESLRPSDFLDRGACAFLSKRITGAALVDALTRVHAGHVVAPDPEPRQCAGRIPAPHGQVLTVREAEVLSHIASGLTNTEIAQTLVLSVNSIKSYIRSCYSKIGVDSRSKAVLWALSNGLGDAQG